MLADEPTGNLDQANGAAVLELLRGLSGRAVVLVTHEPQAAAIADRVLRLQGGRLSAEPAAEQRLIAEPAAEQRPTPQRRLRLTERA